VAALERDPFGCHGLFFIIKRHIIRNSMPDSRARFVIRFYAGNEEKIERNRNLGSAGKKLNG
jgi:hypothetical protein